MSYKPMKKSRGMRINILDLPPEYQKQINGYNKTMDALPIDKPKGRQPTKTEQEYFDRYLFGKDARFEGITLKMKNGHKYTADFLVYENRSCDFCGQSKIELHEIKGSYRLGSYQRAKLAFDQAKIEFPMFRFIWAEKDKEKGWIIS